MNINGLQSLGLNITNYEDLLIPIIMKVLPVRLQYQIAEKLPRKRKIVEVMNLILNYIEVRERCEAMTSQFGKVKVIEPSQKNLKDVVPMEKYQYSSMKFQHPNYQNSSSQIAVLPPRDYKQPTSSIASFPINVNKVQNCSYCHGEHSANDYALIV